MGLICLVFMGFFQVSQLLAAREILAHAAARGARAKTVGFNRWMISKVVRVAAIPNAGRLLVPDFENESPALRAALAAAPPGRVWDAVVRGGLAPSTAQVDLERARIPEYLASRNRPQSQHVLDYAGWDGIGLSDLSAPAPDDAVPLNHIRVRQDVPLWLPLHRAFYAEDTVRLHGDAFLESHYAFYMDPYDWER